MKKRLPKNVFVDSWEEISVSEAARRLGVSRTTLYLDIDAGLITAPVKPVKGGQPACFEWPKVRDQFFACRGRKRPRKLKETRTPYDQRILLERAMKAAGNDPTANVFIQPPQAQPHGKGSHRTKNKEPIIVVQKAPKQPPPLPPPREELGQLNRIRAAATAIKAKQDQERFAAEKVREPYTIRADRAKAEKEETNAASALIELHLKAKTLMPVEELEDRLRERDSILRDRLSAMVSWIKEQHENVSHAICDSIQTYLDDSLQSFGKGILTKEERENAEELKSILAARQEAEGLSTDDTQANDDPLGDDLEGYTEDDLGTDGGSDGT